MVGNSEEEKRKVLFVCIGNSCRSQMAEGFARKYGADILEVSSGGIAPASIVQPLTKKVMADKNIDLEDQFPKHYSVFDLNTFDVIVNISGFKLPFRPVCELREWNVVDPIRRSEEVYVEVRDQIENLVMRLILELRGPRAPEKPRMTIRGGSEFRMGRRRH